MVRKSSSKPPIAFFYWCFQVFVVLGLAGVVVWLSLIPKHPSFTVLDVSVPAINNNSTRTNHQAARNSSIVFVLQTFNPNNKMTIYYNDMYLSLYHRDVAIGTKLIPGFAQGGKESLVRNVSIKGDQMFRGGVADRVFDLRLRLETVVRYRIFKWKSKSHSVVCEGGLVIDSKGRIVGEKNVRLHQM